jgi:hypothetical protein
VAHRELVSWQAGESNQLGKLIKATDRDGWKRLCANLLSPTLHHDLGQWLAFIYATERFYLFENLIPQDFEPNNDTDLGSLQDYLREAEAIRDDHSCIERVPSYREFREQYKAYFNLYTAQLRIMLLSSENNSNRRNSLIDTIGRELEEATRFGPVGKSHSLLAVGDIWERHRVRLTLLKGQLEEEKNR